MSRSAGGTAGRFRSSRIVNDPSLTPSLYLPPRRPVGRVGAEGSRADRILEVEGEDGMFLVDLGDRVLDPAGHGLAGALRDVACLAGATAEAEGGGELVAQEID